MASESNQQKTDRYLRLLEDVSDVVRKYDPIGLLEMGAPRDEYDMLVQEMLPRLRLASGPSDVQRIIHAQFVESFDEATAGAPSHYEPVAREVWRAWMRFKDTEV